MKTPVTNPPAAGEAAHTPTPWAVLPGVQNQDEIHIGNDGDGGPVICSVWPLGPEFSAPGQGTHAERAAFIVRACNAHASYEALLDRCAGYFELVGGKNNGLARDIRAALDAAKEGKPV